MALSGRRRSGRRIALGAAVLAAIAGIGVATMVTADAGTETLLSAGRPAAASSSQDEQHQPGNAVDGRTATGWASTPSPDPQWLRVDLGASLQITRVRLVWDRFFARAYRVQVADDAVTWVDLAVRSDRRGGTDTVRGLTGRGRYLRVFATAGRTNRTTRGYALLELQVFGPEPAGSAPGAAGPVAQRPLPTTPGRHATTTAPARERTGTDAPTRTRTGTPTGTPTGTGQRTGGSPAGGVDLTDPGKKDIAMQLVSSAENSSLNWRAQYQYIQDIGDGRGYTGGIIGFCSGTGDMLSVVRRYTATTPGNGLARYLPALQQVNGGDSHAGLDPGFPAAWRAAAADPAFQSAQDAERDAGYFTPAVAQAKADGLHALGQFIYYDAMVMHGPGSDPVSFGGIRKTARARARTPADGGSEATYLAAFLDARVAAMRTEAAHSNTSRVDTAQRVFLAAGNLDLDPPLRWKVYGEPYQIGS